jgi:MSHA biogenesis protein MshO
MGMHRPRQAGFTLVEAIIVMAIIGIIGAIVAVFIRIPVQNYADSVARAEVTDEADLALRRMARELRLALPNSIRVNADGSAIEFLLTKTGGRYLSLEDNLAPAFPVLDFVGDSTRPLNVTVVGALSQPVLTTDYFVVYNLGNGMAPADAWAYSTNYGAGTPERNIARVSAVAVDTQSTTLTLEGNPFAMQAVKMPSPGQRFQIVSGPVMYACARAADNALVVTRYAGHGITATQATPPADPTSSAPLTRRVNSCAGLFTYDAAAQRSALVTIALELAARTAVGTAATSSIRLVDQVHVDNTP